MRFKSMVNNNERKSYMSLMEHRKIIKKWYIKGDYDFCKKVYHCYKMLGGNMSYNSIINSVKK